MGNFKNKRKYDPCCWTEHIEKSKTLKILERSYVLGDERFVGEDGSKDDDEEDLEVLACI
jgi:hypothetical protein